MPPEPLPWDRKDFFKERKHHGNHHNERASDLSLGGGGGGGGGGSHPRWRDYSSSHHGREFPRWGSDFRRPSGHGKQGNWHPFCEESVHGYAPSRSVDKLLEDENCRFPFSRGDGKYSRNGRESRGSSSQRDGKGHSWEASNGFSNTPGRMYDLKGDQRSIDDMSTYPSHPQSDLVNTWDHIQLKDLHGNKTDGIKGFGTGRRCERETSLDWKPLKWTRSGSLSSRGSGLSHSSSSKSMGGVDSTEGKGELQTKIATPVQSPSGDAAVCVTSAVPAEELTSRKKQRLGWGEGLAKYEKKKVEGPDLRVCKEGAAVSTCSSEPVCSNLVEKSPRVMGFMDCASPATPSSFACSSSPGVEEKGFGKAPNVENDFDNACGSPSIESQDRQEGSLFNLEKLDTNLLPNLGSSLNELLQSDDPTPVDSNFVRSTAMNKLLIWKGDILKALEMTESEIDSLEIELKSIKSALGSRSPRPAASSSLLQEGDDKLFAEHGAPSHSITRPAPLQIESCEDFTTTVKIPLSDHGLDEVHGNVKDDDIDSPGTATSKFVEPLSLVKAISPLDAVKNDEYCGALNANQSTNLEAKHPVCNFCEEELNGASAAPDCRFLVESKNAAPNTRDFSSYADKEKALCDVILSSNRESACKAAEVFTKLLPKDHCARDIPGVVNVLSCAAGSMIKEKFEKKKKFLKFKERILVLKFKALQHQWKEDMHLRSMRKYRAKTQKRSELGVRTVHNSHQKHRSIRSRQTSPVAAAAAANLSLVPASEVIGFTGKLISESQVKVYRNFLKMPALLLEKKEKMRSRFISNNGLVEDPFAVEKERALINPWTSEEKDIFLDKLATYGKDFRKIASFLDYKTTADCVEFYYKNHKSDCFDKIKKKHGMSKQGKSLTNTYMVTSGKKWDRKMNAASLDILGEASVMAAAAQAENDRQIYSRKISLVGCSDSKISLGDDVIMERSGSFDVLGNERETVAADVLAGIYGSLSSEAMSSCTTSSIDLGEGQRELKHQKIDSVVRRPSTPDVTQNVDDDTCSDDSCGEMGPSRWTAEEKSLFIQGLTSYGRDFAMISRRVRSKSRNQCKVFYSKTKKCLGLRVVHSGRANVGTSASEDGNDGGTDTEDLGVLETSSVIYSGGLDTKMEEDLPSSVMIINQDESEPGGTINMQTEPYKSEGAEVSKDVVEPMVSDELKTDNESGQVAELDKNSMICAGEQSELVVNQKTAVTLTDAEAGRDQGASVAVSVSVGETMDCCRSGLNGVVESNDVIAKDSMQGSENSSEGRDILLPESSSNDELGKGFCADVSVESEMVQDSNKLENDLNLLPKSEQDLSKLDFVDKPHVITLPRKNSVAAAEAFVSPDSSLECEKSLTQDRLSSTVDLEESKDKNVRKSVSCDNNHQHLLSGQSIFNQIQSSQILKGYPLHFSTRKEMNGDISCRQISEVQSMSDSERSVSESSFSRDCYLQKCTSSAPSSCTSSAPNSSSHDLPLLSQNMERTGSHYPRAHSRSLSDTEKPCRKGDVKLFGKILSRPSSTQKPHCNHENDDKSAYHHNKQSSKASSNLKFTGHHPTDGGSTLFKFDHSNYPALENVPVRSYGFWDGSRIQTGFASLPDSAILLAKYPAAFSNYPTSSTIKSNENGMTGGVLPQRELVDYQVYRSRDGNNSRVHPFTVDVKQQQERMLTEMQRPNGFDTTPNLQPAGRGLMGMNVVGRGGLLVNGSCTGVVSDPVAAIKMHYAKTDQSGIMVEMQKSGSIVREEESWRGKRDISR